MTLNFPIILLDSTLYLFCIPRVLTDVHFSASIFNWVSPVLMGFYSCTVFIFYQWPSHASLVGGLFPPSPKASPHAHSSLPLTMAPGAGCVLLLCPGGFSEACSYCRYSIESRHLLFLPTTSPKHVTNTYLP